MKYLGKNTDNKDLVTKEYADSRVVANPTLAGSESDLTALQVNGTKYKVASGLPAVSAADNGKVLTVVSGAWAAASLPVYNGGVS